MKQNQILAVEKGAKARGDIFTKVYQQLAKPDLLDGFSRTYRPVVDTDVVYPGETKIVQLKSSDALKTVENALSDWFDVAATKEFGNLLATASVTVDGKVLLPKVPVTYLLFLEKRLVDLHTFVSKLPVLDPSVKWTLNTQSGLYESDPISTTKTKKTTKVVTLAAATDKHPAQAQLAHEDIPEGFWETTKFSGAMAPTDRAALVSKVEKLQAAVKMAREEANSIEVTMQSVAPTVFGYLFS